MAQQFSNNARALLTTSITSSATSLVIESTKADLFPVANVGSGSIPSANSWFKLTLQDSSGNVEIVAVRTRTAGSGVLSNVIRGYDGTTARAFVSGTVVGLRITAEDVQTALDLPNQNIVFSGDNSFSGANEFTGTQTFSGVTSFDDSPTAPTATYGDSTTKVATTAFVQAALQALYPVGSIYTNAGVTTNPATLFGFGTWVAFGAGRVMVGLSGSDPAFDALEETGGSKDAVVVAHGHPFSGTTSSVGDHQHLTTSTLGGSAYGQGASIYVGFYDGASTFPQNLTAGAGAHNHTYSGTTVSEGVSGTNANLQPYITVAMWKRTA